MTVHCVSGQVDEVGDFGSPAPGTRAGEEVALSVSVIDGVDALERFAADIDRFNQLAARPNPFMSSAHLQCYARHSEYHHAGREERLYLFHAGNRLVGCAPMRRSVDRFGPGKGVFSLQRTRLRLLAPLDTEQPGILSEPGAEVRVARALLQHLLTQELRSDLIDFVGQPPGSVLHRAAHEAAGRRFRVRDLAVEPYNEIALDWPDLHSYFLSLAKKMRSNLGRQARRLFAKGAIELVFAEGPAATTAWFDAFCEIDGKSWKGGTAASISRNPQRQRYYREIVAGRGGLEPGFAGILLDGALVAGLITGGNAAASPGRHGTWLLETAYDRAHGEVGPGNLVLLMAVGEAIRRGDRYLNFMQNFAYYKYRWGAAPVDVLSVQLIRRRSLHNVRALLGDARRWLQSRRYVAMRAAATAAEPVSDDEVGAPQAERPDLRAVQDCAAAALRFSGPGVRILDRTQAELYLPFPTR